MADGPPHLHDGEAALQELVRLFGQQIAHALRPGPFGVVVVDAAHDLADLERLAHSVVGGAQRVVEDDDSRRAGFGLHQRFHLGIINPPQLGLGEKIGHLSVVMHETEAIALERETVGDAPAIVDDDAMRIELAATAHLGRSGTTGEGEGRLSGIDEIIEYRLDRVGGGLRLRRSRP